MSTRPSISTHVLDTAAGAPAAGVPVRLSRFASNGDSGAEWTARTDADGRVADLLEGAELVAGAYRLAFDIATYRAARGERTAFFRSLTLDITIDDTARSYHVPLLLAPFGCTTYRGS